MPIRMANWNPGEPCERRPREFEAIGTVCFCKNSSTAANRRTRCLPVTPPGSLVVHEVRMAVADFLLHPAGLLDGTLSSASPCRTYTPTPW